MSYQQPPNRGQWQQPPFKQQPNTSYPPQQSFPSQPLQQQYPPQYQQQPPMKPPTQSPKKKQSSFLMPGLIIFVLMACSFISGMAAMYHSITTSTAVATTAPDIAATN